MPSWIVQFGRSRITAEPAAFAPPLLDRLELGPHHPDFEVQRLMRLAWWRETVWPEERSLAHYRQVLADGDELILWWNRDLSATLAMCWLIDRLETERADFTHISAVLDPGRSGCVSHSAEAFQNLLEARFPAAELSPACPATRRHIASDSEQVVPDLSVFPKPVRPWAQTVEGLVDFLPDERGLDRFDGLLMDQLTVDWQEAVHPIVAVILGDPDCRIADDTLWLRLVELSDQQSILPGGTGSRERSALCELKLAGPAAMRTAQVRITAYGEAVRAGEVDALKHRRFARWVGGRFLTHGRIIRRPGAERHE